MYKNLLYRPGGALKQYGLKSNNKNFYTNKNIYIIINIPIDSTKNNFRKNKTQNH